MNLMLKKNNKKCVIQQSLNPMNLNSIERYWISPLIKEYTDSIETIRRRKSNEHFLLDESCAVISHQSPHIIVYDKFNILRKFISRKTKFNSLSYAKNYREFLLLVFAHELGHIEHERLLQRKKETEIIQFLLNFPLFSEYHRDGWRDIFAETYALYLTKPELFAKEDYVAFQNFLQN